MYTIYYETQSFNTFFTNREEEFEDTKGILRIIEEEQTTQWLKEKGQKDKQRSTKYMHKTNLWAH
jgi:hypothetical protein